MRLLIGFEIIVMIMATMTFVVRYLWVPMWWKTTIGRVMMGIASGLGIFFLMLMLSGFWDFPLLAWAIVLGALDVLFVAQVVLLFQAQKRRKDRADKELFKIRDGRMEE